MENKQMEIGEEVCENCNWPKNQHSGSNLICPNGKGEWKSGFSSSTEELAGEVIEEKKTQKEKRAIKIVVKKPKTEEEEYEEFFKSIMGKGGYVEGEKISGTKTILKKEEIKIKESIKMAPEKKKEIPERLERIIFILADKIMRKTSFAVGGSEAKQVKEKYGREWFKEKFLPRIIEEQKAETGVRASSDWLIILEELENRVPEAAKEFIKEYRKEYKEKLGQYNL